MEAEPIQPRPVRLVIVEDHVALRRGLEMLLEREGFDIRGVAGDARRGYDLIRATRPDVALIDVRLPVGDGVGLARRLLNEDPRLGILLYTAVEDQATLEAALDTGARGFALKTRPPEELGRAIRTVAAGGAYVDPGLRFLLSARGTTERIRVLSPREREVLDHLAQGLTGEEIAERLSLSPLTVRTHIRNSMGKLQANTRAHAIVIALRRGELSLEGSGVADPSQHG